jgi:hypothetical protein
MNAGFSNLTFLKSKLLLASDAAGTDYDAAVTALGLGVAGMFEAMTDRKFSRVVGDTHEAPADRCTVIVPRYPIESVTAVDLRCDMTTGWESQTGQPQNFNPTAGIVIFLYPLAYRGCTVRITYTGGYWWDTSEDSSGSLPSGATAIPQALVQAWVIACRFFWDRQSIEDRAKAGFSDKDAERFLSSDSKLPALVTETINRFRRFA